MSEEQKMHPLVLIEWEDSRQPTSCWQWLEDYKSQGAVQNKTAGFLIDDGDKVKAVAQSMGDDGEQVSGVMHIPTTCITKLTRL